MGSILNVGVNRKNSDKKQKKQSISAKNLIGLICNTNSSEVCDMLYNLYNEKILGIQEVNIKKVEEKEDKYEITLEKPRKKCVCPVCGSMTDHVHDYREQKVSDLSAFGKKVVLFYRKRRYVCSCGSMPSAR